MIDTLSHTAHWSPKQREIHLAAARMFSHYGYPGTSMRALAETIGLEGSSLYSHIKNKQELLHNICFLAADRYLDGLQDIIAKGQSPLQKLEALVDLHILIALEMPTSIIVFNDEWRHLQNPALDEFVSRRKDYEFQVTELISQAQQEGSIVELPPKILFDTLVSSLQWIYHSTQINDLAHRTQLQQTLKTILFDGIQNSKP